MLFCAVFVWATSEDVLKVHTEMMFSNERHSASSSGFIWPQVIQNWPIGVQHCLNQSRLKSYNNPRGTCHVHWFVPSQLRYRQTGRPQSPVSLWRGNRDSSCTDRVHPNRPTLKMKKLARFERPLSFILWDGLFSRLDRLGDTRHLFFSGHSSQMLLFLNPGLHSNRTAIEKSPAHFLETSGHLNNCLSVQFSAEWGSSNRAT